MKKHIAFATTFLNINVINDFRMRRSNPYYSIDGAQSVDGMKIIPLQTSEIKIIIEKKLTYNNLYLIFKEAYDSVVAPNVWYQQELVNRF